jgi:hypothetical protein
MQERVERVITDVHDVLLKFLAPGNIFALFCVISVERKGREHGIEGRKRSGGDVEDTHGCIGKRGRGRESGGKSYVVDGNHVDGIIHVWHETELDAALHHSPDEVVRVSN